MMKDRPGKSFLRRKVVLAAAGLAVVLSAIALHTLAPATSTCGAPKLATDPMPFYMTVEGDNQGTIEGSCQDPGYEGTIKCYQLDHDVYLPTDPVSGQPTGHLVLAPLRVVYETGKASPKLMQALVSGERLHEVILMFDRISSHGQHEHYFTITLSNARIISIRPFIPDVLDANNEQYGHMEQISFVYGDLTWEGLDIPGHEIPGPDPEFLPDVTGDNCVNVLDLLSVRGNLGRTGSLIDPPEADTDGDGRVNVLDLLAVRGALGKGSGCP